MRPFCKGSALLAILLIMPAFAAAQHPQDEGQNAQSVLETPEVVEVETLDIDPAEELEPAPSTAMVPVIVIDDCRTLRKLRRAERVRCRGNCCRAQQIEARAIGKFLQDRCCQ